VLAPALEPGFQRAFFVATGRIADVRTLPPGGGALVEIEAGLAAARTLLPPLGPEQVDELLLLGSFLRRPPPELAILPLEAGRIAATHARLSASASRVLAAG
jgi:hypothetical protein